MKDLLKKALGVLPGAVMDAARWIYEAIPPRIRFGPEYPQALALLAASDDWSESRLRACQDELLVRLVHHSYRHVPYYRKVFDEHGLRPGDIGGVADLGRIPLLTKELVRNNKTAITARNVPRLKRQWISTSGSTGSPLDFQIDQATRAMDRAQALRRLRWVGYRPGDRVADLRADPFTDPRRLYQYYPTANRLGVAFFGADDRYLERMVGLLQRFRPDFILVFPSNLGLLARWLERNGRYVPAPRYILSSSEVLYPSVKEHAERVLGGTVVDGYGQNELVAYATQCSQARGYHEQMELGALELIPTDGDLYEIVGTCLHNLAMPFIRYRTGDLARPLDTPCPCGRAHPQITDVIGRTAEVIVTPEGRWVTPVSMDYAVYHLEEIKEVQIVQEDIRTLRLRVVPWETLTRRTEERLREAVAHHLESPSMRILIEQAREIPCTARGKKPFVISRLPQSPAGIPGGVHD